MSLFKCSKCDCIENTAVSNYWMRKDKLCSQCDPEIGKWHGRFPRTLATDYKLGNDGFLYQVEEVQEGGYSFGRIQRGELKIVGDAMEKGQSWALEDKPKCRQCGWTYQTQEGADICTGWGEHAPNERTSNPEKP